MYEAGDGLILLFGCPIPLGLLLPSHLNLCYLEPTMLTPAENIRITIDALGTVVCPSDASENKLIDIICDLYELHEQLTAPPTQPIRFPGGSR